MLTSTLISVLFSFQILAIICASMLIRHIDREKTGSLDPSNPKRYRGGVHEIPMPDSKPR